MNSISEIKELPGVLANIGACIEENRNSAEERFVMICDFMTSVTEFMIITNERLDKIEHRDTGGEIV